MRGDIVVSFVVVYFVCMILDVLEIRRVVLFLM